MAVLKRALAEGRECPFKLHNHDGPFQFLDDLSGEGSCAPVSMKAVLVLCPAQPKEVSYLEGMVLDLIKDNQAFDFSSP